MSNETLIARIEGSLQDLRSDKISACLFARIIESNGSALEGMPYVLIQEMKRLAGEIHIAEWYDEDGFSPELEPLLVQTEHWLSLLPRNI
jgi:hypothetical protein